MGAVGRAARAGPHVPIGPVAGPVAVEVPPWPGAIPGPAPARVLAPPVAAALVDGRGRAVVVSARGDLSAPPARVECVASAAGGGVVTAWAGPWAQDVRWWDRTTRARRVTWQVVVDDAVACLVEVEQRRGRRHRRLRLNFGARRVPRNCSSPTSVSGDVTPGWLTTLDRCQFSDLLRWST